VWTVLCLWILVCVKVVLFMGDQRDGTAGGRVICVWGEGIVVVCIYARELIMVASLEVYD